MIIKLFPLKIIIKSISAAQLQQKNPQSNKDWDAPRSKLMGEIDDYESEFQPKRKKGRLLFRESYEDSPTETHPLGNEDDFTKRIQRKFEKLKLLETDAKFLGLSFGIKFWKNSEICEEFYVIIVIFYVIL